MSDNWYSITGFPRATEPDFRSDSLLLIRCSWFPPRSPPTPSPSPNPLADGDQLLHQRLEPAVAIARAEGIVQAAVERIQLGIDLGGGLLGAIDCGRTPVMRRWAC